MGNKRKPKEAESGGGKLQRAAKAREKASARAKKVQANVHEWSSQLDTALMALEKTDVGSPKAREVEEAARAALKKLVVRRKKLRKARKALRRAEAKERKALDRAAVVAAKTTGAEAPAAQSREASNKRPAQKRQAEKAPAQAPAAQSRKVSKTRPARKRPAKARAKSSAPKPSVLDTMAAIEADSGVDTGGVEPAPDKVMK